MSLTGKHSDIEPMAEQLKQRLSSFMDEYIYPFEREYRQYWGQYGESAENRWVPHPHIEHLKSLAREQGLWNLFLPDAKLAAGLNNLQYAPLAEIMGRVIWAPEIFNCNAPDTGNMEVLYKYGSPAQQDRWLKPLLDGEIRSGFAMTEPDVASSDATNIQCSIVREGDHYRINGRKWFTTGAMNTRCKILIVMGKTNPEASRHQQQSQVLVPMDTPGVRLVRPLKTFGYDDPPLGHAELAFEDVCVPLDNIILGEGRGFEIAQGRLGPGRIHHCMRLIGCAQRALELALKRVEERETFGRKLSQHQSVLEDIATSYCAIEQARLLTFKAAEKIDSEGTKAAQDLIAAIKIVGPSMACQVIDKVIQIHGAGGLSEDYFLAEAYNYARQIRIADGPDQVHMMSLGKQLIRNFS